MRAVEVTMLGRAPTGPRITASAYSHGPMAKRRGHLTRAGAGFLSPYA